MLLQTSKADYQNQIEQEIRKFDDPEYIPEPGSYFYENDDFEDGEQAARLTNYLDKFIYCYRTHIDRS